MISDGHSYERIVVFGGIQNTIKASDAVARQQRSELMIEHGIENSMVDSFLTNRTYQVQVIMLNQEKVSAAKK